MPQQLEGKLVLVTGAASGIGAACAELALQRDARVVGIDRVEPPGELADRLAIPWELCDLTALDALPGLVARCVEQHGKIDGLVNAAGIYQTAKLLEMTPDDYDRMFAINVRAVVFMQQAVARHMVDSGGGSIVNFSSTAARIPRPISSHYAASKAAIVSFTRSAAVALAGDGVRVNAVSPGNIQTPMIEAVLRERAVVLGITPEELRASYESEHPIGRFAQPSEVAEVVVFLLSDAASYVSGESVGINGSTDDVG